MTSIESLSPAIDISNSAAPELQAKYSETRLRTDIIEDILSKHLVAQSPRLPRLHINLLMDAPRAGSRGLYDCESYPVPYIGVSLNPGILYPGDDTDFNFGIWHELKHFIDDRNGILRSELDAHHRKITRDIFLPPAIAAIALAAASRRSLRNAASMAFGASAAKTAGAWHDFYMREYGPWGKRLELYRQLPWERRANEFAEAHRHLTVIETTPLPVATGQLAA